MSLQSIGGSGAVKLDEKSVEAGEMESTSPDLAEVSNEDSVEDRRRDTNRKVHAVSENMILLVFSQKKRTVSTSNVVDSSYYHSSWL